MAVGFCRVTCGKPAAPASLILIPKGMKSPGGMSGRDKPPGKYAAGRDTNLAPGSPVCIDARYTVRQSLGGGATSVVYRAYDELLKRDVVIKLYSSHGKHWTGDDRKSFLKEAKFAAGLTHPNVAAIYSVGIADGDPFIVMELIEGKSLASHLASEGTMPVHQALAVVEQVSLAAHHLHRNGLIHRDIKPANIMLSNHEGELIAKLIDLGLAKRDSVTLRLQGQNVTETIPGLAIGTPSYMSPEQVCGDKVDSRSDVFSLGTVLYEAVTGRCAFEADQIVARMMITLNSDPAPMSEASPDVLVPAAIENIALIAMSKNPAERFQSAAELAENLAAVRTALLSGKPLPVVRKPKASTYKNPAKPMPGSSAPRLLPALTAFLLLVCAVGAIWFHNKINNTTGAQPTLEDGVIKASAPEQFDGHRKLQELYFKQWVASHGRLPRTQVILEAERCLKLSAWVHQPFEMAKVQLRASVVEGDEFSQEQFQSVIDYILAAIRKDRGPDKRELQRQLDEIDQLIDQFASSCQRHPTVAFDLFTPALRALTAQHDYLIAFTQSLRMLHIQQKVAPSSTVIPWSYMTVSSTAFTAGDEQSARYYHSLTQQCLQMPGRFGLSAEAQAELRLDSDRLEHSLEQRQSRR